MSLYEEQQTAIGIFFCCMAGVAFLLAMTVTSIVTKNMCSPKNNRRISPMIKLSTSISLLCHDSFLAILIVHGINLILNRQHARGFDPKHIDVELCAFAVARASFHCLFSTRLHITFAGSEHTLGNTAFIALTLLNLSVPLLVGLSLAFIQSRQYLYVALATAMALDVALSVTDVLLFVKRLMKLVFKKQMTQWSRRSLTVPKISRECIPVAEMSPPPPTSPRALTALTPLPPPDIIERAITDTDTELVVRNDTIPDVAMTTSESPAEATAETPAETTAEMAADMPLGTPGERSPDEPRRMIRPRRCSDPSCTSASHRRTASLGMRAPKQRTLYIITKYSTLSAITITCDMMFYVLFGAIVMNPVLAKNLYSFWIFNAILMFFLTMNPLIHVISMFLSTKLGNPMYERFCFAPHNLCRALAHKCIQWKTF